MIAFDKPTREALSRMLARRLGADFDLEIAPMDAQRLLDMLSETLGPAFYNQGLADAEAVLKDRIETIGEAIAGLGKPVPRV